MKKSDAIISCENINKSFGGKRVLENFSLLVGPGEMICMRGPSGCGKSTLLNIIGLLERPDSGLIKMFGKRTPKGGSKYAQKLIRNEINFLMQGFALIESLSVEKNLLFSLKYLRISEREKNKIITSSLERVGLEGRQNEIVAHLSGGEQQRVALARCMVKPGRIVIADEPTGSLDPANRDVVIGLLRGLSAQGKTIVLATHDEKVAASCDEVIELEGLS